MVVELVFETHSRLFDLVHEALESEVILGSIHNNFHDSMHRLKFSKKWYDYTLKVLENFLLKIFG